MKRVLLVANRTACEQHLIEEIRRRRAEAPTSFHLLVPATHPAGAWTDEQCERMAKERLDEAVEVLATAGISVTASVGDANPVAAVGDLLRHDHFEEIIVSTLPQGASRWLGQNVVRRMQKAYGLPVTHVVGDPATVG